MNPDLLLGIFIGFFGIGFVILLGYLGGKTRLIPPTAHNTLNSVAFNIALPALYFRILAEADLGILLSSFLTASIIPMVIAIFFGFIIFRYLQKKSLAESVLLTGGSIYANTGNIGIPLTLYVLGTATYTAPIILIQILVLTPVMVVILEALNPQNRRRRLMRFLKPALNPVFLAMLMGLIAALTGVQLPAILITPISMVADMAIPMILVALGISLIGTNPLKIPKDKRSEILTVTIMKLILAPILTYLFAALVFGITGIELFAVVLLSSLSTAQTIYLLGDQYKHLQKTSQVLVIYTMIISVPIIFLIAMLLG